MVEDQTLENKDNIQPVSVSYVEVRKYLCLQGEVQEARK